MGRAGFARSGVRLQDRDCPPAIQAAPACSQETFGRGKLNQQASLSLSCVSCRLAATLLRASAQAHAHTINTHLMNSRLAGSLPSSHRYRVRVTPGGTSAARAAVTVLVMTSRDSCVGVWGRHRVCVQRRRQQDFESSAHARRRGEQACWAAKETLQERRHTAATPPATDSLSPLSCVLSWHRPTHQTTAGASSTTQQQQE